RLAAVLGIAISVDFQNADAHTVGDVADDGSIGNLIDRTRS
ncbi:MAG: hypothetical protein ACJA0Z_004698, partial [Halioglobus sp.]